MQFSKLNDPAVKRLELIQIDPLYEQIRDCLEGQAAVKKRRTKYLPQPNPADTSQYNMDRYNQYLTRAIFTNVVGETNEMFQGQLQLKPAKLILPDSIAPMIENADGQGLNLRQMIKDAAGCVVPFSRGGWYVEFPERKQGKTSFTKADIASGIAPTVRFIKPWNIYNWMEERVGNAKRVTMVVIREKIEYRPEDALRIEYRERFQVLMLEGKNRDKAVVYVVAKDKDRQNGGISFRQKKYTLLDASGKQMTDLPFRFIGSQNNDASIDKPLLENMSNLNLGHYRCSADFFESVHRVGQPTPIIKVSEHWAKNILKNKMTLGSWEFVPIDKDGDVKYLQAEANILSQQGMTELMQQMQAAGAELVREQSTVERKQSEIEAEGSAKTSKLGKLASNIETSLMDVLKIAHSFMSTKKLEENQLLVNINKVYNAGAKTTAQLREMNELFQAGDPVISKTEFRSQLRLAGIAEQDDQTAFAEIDEMIKARSDRALEVAKSTAALAVDKTKTGSKKEEE